MTLTRLMEFIKSPAVRLATEPRVFWRAVRRIDVRRPTHMVVIGVIVSGIAAPVLSWMAEEARYQLAPAQASVMAHPSPSLASKLVYDEEKKANYFNRDGEAVGKDSLAMMAGAGGKNGKSAYSAKMPAQAGSGIRVSDATSGVAVIMKPQFATMDGRIVGARVLYPLKDAGGVLALTPKANGLKEDILLEYAMGDRVQFDYELVVPESLKAKMMPDGGVGFYSGDPALFGNITYGSDKDRETVEKARKTAEKNYLMFEIPAPVVKQSEGGSSAVKARFELEGTTLSVITAGLAKAAYPLSIDPTFVITSASEFNLGRVEDNITVDTANDQLVRGTITNGLVDSSGWQSAVAGNLPAACLDGTLTTDYNFGMTAYNGYLYLVGGGAGAGTFTCYTAINSNGTLGGWTTTNKFATGRTGACVVGWNGYLYVMGGETANGGTQFTTVEYAAIGSTGGLTWNPGGAGVAAMGAGRTYFGCVVYAGYIYAYGGATAKNNGQLIATVEYTKIKADGTLAYPVTGCTPSGSSTAWCTGPSFTTARDRFGAVAYNGYIYVIGGLASSSVLTDVQYAPIKSDGSLGSWITASTTLPARRSMGVAVERGYVYLIGGCSTTPSCSGLLSSTVYAPLYADGSVGTWDTTASITNARLYNGGASYNGYLYTVGGCFAEPTNNNNCSGTGNEYGDSQYAKINTTPGDVSIPAATSSLTVARAGVATTAYNGYIYAAGGCNGTNCGTRVATVDYAQINDDGTIGTWAATNGLVAARYGGVLAGFGGKLYYLGGDDGTGNGTNVVYSASPVSNGSISSPWTNETNTFATGRYWHTATVWANYLYITGGQGSGGPFNTIEYTQLVNGSWTSPANCVSNGGTLNNNWCKVGSGSNFSTARYGHAGVAYDGNLYIVAGQDGSNNLLSDSQKASLASADGYVGAFTSIGQASLPAPGTDTAIGHRFISAAAHNSVLYVYGGLNNGASAANTIVYAPLDSSGNVTAWTKSGRTLVTARWGAGGVAYNGNLYAVGGCSSNAAPPCTAYLSTSDYALPRNGGTGMTSVSNASDWSNQASPAVSARADAQYVAYNGYLYILGGCVAYLSGACDTALSSNFLTSIYYSPISETGAPGTWTANGTSLTTGRTYGGAVAYNGKIYLISGSTPSTTDSTSAEYWTVGTNGALTGPTALTSLSAGRHGFGITQSGGYIYLVGGLNGTTKKNDIVYSQIASDGTVTAPSGCSGVTWCTSGSTFTNPRQDLQAVAYNSVLYVIGGYDGTDSLGDVQYAALSNTNGSIGTFKYTTYQDRGGRGRGAFALNGYLYFLGSENSGTDVFYTAVNANNTLGNLYRASTNGMPSASLHAHGAYMVYNGFFYVVGGCTLSGGVCSSTNVNNRVDYVGQKAQARLGHYSKLFDTQVDTAPAQVQVNAQNGLLASGGSKYIVSMQTASQSDPVLGIAQLINPVLPGLNYAIQALNSSGTNVGLAFNYYIFLTIDDSGSGAFPDTASTATDITIFYHANPGRRLRHGASFTNTGCNVVAANGCILDTAP